MDEKKELSDSALEFGKALFGSKMKKEKNFIKEKAIEPEKVKEIKKPKEYCPYCGKGFINVKRHIKNCPLNPNITKEENTEYYFKEPPLDTTYETKAKRKIVYIEEEISRPNWAALIAEGVQTLKSLTEYLNELRKNPIRIKLIK